MTYDYPEIPLQVMAVWLGNKNDEGYRGECICELFKKWSWAKQEIKGAKFKIKNHIRIVVSVQDDPDKIFNLIKRYDEVLFRYARLRSRQYAR